MIARPGTKMMGEWTTMFSAFLLPVLLVLLDVTPGRGDLRLQGADSSTYGRLEIYYNGEWGTVCNDNFGEEEARVACRELGLDTSVVQFYNTGKFGEGNGTIWLDEVNCNGFESTLKSCDHNIFGSHDCYHSEDVGISCGAYVGSGDLRLRGDDSNTYGRLEIYYNGEWGTVCNDNFGEEEARVACRQLGLVTSPVEYFDGSKFGEGNGTIWLDEVNCNGFESTLESCDHNILGSHDCVHSEDVGISCGTGDSGSTGGVAFWGGIGRYTVGIVFFIVIAASFGGSMYRRRQLYLRRQQHNNTAFVHPPATAMVHVTANSNASGTTPMPNYHHNPTPQQQPGEPRPYPVQTYSPVYPPQAAGGNQPPSYPVQAYPPSSQNLAGQDPQYRTKLPPVEGTAPYPPQQPGAPPYPPQQTGAPPYPPQQPGDASTVYPPQSNNIPEGDLPPPPSYHDIVQQ